MTLKQLEAFYAAATCASFAVAAQRLHLSISSLSKRIAELELSLGETLFDRGGHRAALTTAGHRLLPHAADVLASAERLTASLGKEAGMRGRCRFGVGELAALTWLPALLRAAGSAYPQLALEPYVDIGTVLERGVGAGELDFAVVAGRSSRSALASQTIGQARFLWVASGRAARAGADVAALLRELPLVTLHVGAGTTRILDEWLTQQQVTAERRLTCNGWGAVAGMLADGIGVGFLPEGWARALAQRGQLRILDGAPELAPLHYACQWRRDDPRLLVGAMRDLVARVADFSATSALF
ncbi:LysR family transcriptional regulator [Janthinobacterium fluminis]|uniref:LysR family transcriptional regulator n=1 Tax=Janthinobacterium fluminis TaxID=2987524 RepID=A0ABT5KAR5_9BURK|nr:LysR family transcriptional regulator [Janthinobacterium fluminis]MDC8760917.1 LysR family transcriptional regulator [Janthinobacterium fluminis]